MWRNEYNRYEAIPAQKEIRRSHFSDVKYNILGTGNAGYLLPIGAPIEVLPGDTFKDVTAGLVKFQTPLVQVMDKAILETFWFYVPWHQVWDHTKQFFGESEVAGYEQQNTYTIPTIKYKLGRAMSDGKKYEYTTFGEANNNYLDLMGLPTYTLSDDNKENEINALPLRAIRHIWNNYFRDQNLQDTKLVNTGDKETDKTLFDLLKVNKLHDYFTSALPYAQKANPINLNISGAIDIPIYAGDVLSDQEILNYYHEGKGDENGIRIQRADTYQLTSGEPLVVGSIYKNDSSNIGLGKVQGPITNEDGIIPVNLYADMTKGLQSIDIISLRTAFAMQRYYEDLALHGSRYYEYIRGQFGITVPELNIGIPEYLGGSKATIGMQAVINQSASENGDQLGSIGAMSVTTIAENSFNKTFTQHGYLVGLFCVRNRNSYQQGTNRMWKHKELFDIYDRQFANIGEQPIYNYEIFTQGTKEDEEVFGYQERYAEYRTFPSIVTGEFRSISRKGSLDVYHYADFYENLPKLSGEWIESSETNIDRTLSITSKAADQFYYNFEITFEMDRKMPLFGGHDMQGWF